MKVNGLALAALFITLKSGASKLNEEENARRLGTTTTCVPLPGGTLDPCTIPKFVENLVIPSEMPKSSTSNEKDYYSIAVRQFKQQILPHPFPDTTVWGYGSTDHPGTLAEGGSFNNPSLTVEATKDKTTKVKWINDLVDHKGNPLPHLFAIDRTLHWANPEKAKCRDGSNSTDCRPDPTDPSNQKFLGMPYTGPVPIVTHVHGGHSSSDSDGYPEAWYLPAQAEGKISPDTKKEYAMQGRHANNLINRDGNTTQNTGLGYADFIYRNDQPSATIWYHDHTLGMTRLNVAAASAGFWIIREKGGGETGLYKGVLPHPAPRVGDHPNTRYFEIPLAIQDRSFNADGSLFYPAYRAFFEGTSDGQTPTGNEGLEINFLGDTEESDIPPIWNPEAFFNTMVVNGKTWPKLHVEPRRYRFRIVNACDSRFLILKLQKKTHGRRTLGGTGTSDFPFYMIGADQGLLPQVVKISDGLLMGPSERADIIVDFTNLPKDTTIVMTNIGPDEPYGGGVPGVDFASADPGTTGQVMKFRVSLGLSSPDYSTHPEHLHLKDQTRDFPPTTVTRDLALLEEDSTLICVETLINEEGQPVIVQTAGTPASGCPDGSEPFGPQTVLLGHINDAGNIVPQLWEDPPEQRPRVDTAEEWVLNNVSADAHPIHVHLVKFLITGRMDMATGADIPVQPWEAGFKDTVVSLPGTTTTIKAIFDIEGLYVWHCHILSHEDQEMMVPFCVTDADGKCFNFP